MCCDHHISLEHHKRIQNLRSHCFQQLLYHLHSPLKTIKVLFLVLRNYFQILRQQVSSQDFLRQTRHNKRESRSSLISVEFLATRKHRKQVERLSLLFFTTGSQHSHSSSFYRSYLRNKHSLKRYKCFSIGSPPWKPMIDANAAAEALRERKNGLRLKKILLQR